MPRQQQKASRPAKLQVAGAGVGGEAGVEEAEAGARRYKTSTSIALCSLSLLLWPASCAVL